MWTELRSQTLHANICSAAVGLQIMKKTVFEHFKDIELRTISNRQFVKIDLDKLL